MFSHVMVLGQGTAHCRVVSKCFAGQQTQACPWLWLDHASEPPTLNDNCPIAPTYSLLCPSLRNSGKEKRIASYLT